MTILCVIDNLGAGGAQRQLVELATGFKENGHDVSFLVYHDSNFYLQSLQAAGILVQMIIERNYLKRLLKMRAYIRKKNPDVVLSFLEAANFICSLAALPTRKWKLIVGERSANPGMLKSFKAFFFRVFHFIPDYVVANSHSNIKMVRKLNPLLPLIKCKVIYNAIDESVWCSKHSGSFIIDNRFNLIVVASHQYLKNAKGLIEAVNLLPAKDRKLLKVSWYGTISPDSSYKDSVELVTKYGLNDVMSFYPETHSIKEKICSSDALGLFSFYEGLPNVVCEAMMLGKPVIASGVSDIPMFLDNSLTFIPTNVYNITNVLSRILNMEASDLLAVGKKNQEKAISLFSKKEIIRSYLNLFTS